MDEIAAAIEDMRRIAMNITGFHALRACTVAVS